MNKQQITERAGRLESAMRSLKQTKFLARDDSGVKDSEKYILWMLATLNDGRAVTPSEAAKKLNVTLAAITHHINSLEEQKLVVRSASPDDRRVTLISLSDTGAAMVETLRKSYWKKICGLVEYLGDEDSSELIHLITKIHEYLKRSKKNDD
ncbi:MAG: MarR family transcriptional regulator [Actinomycetota bacterium]|nr:MarR family transcriptional regulator [Actinomycetota bacterium]